MIRKFAQNPVVKEKISPNYYLACFDQQRKENIWDLSI